MQRALCRTIFVPTLQQRNTIRNLVSAKRSSSQTTWFPRANPILASFKVRKHSRFLCSAMESAAVEKTVLVPIANGSEEMEAVIVIDVLRRAGSKVTVASVEDSLEVECSRGVKLVADKKIEQCVNEAFDLIALPGGMPGAKRLHENAVLVNMMKQQKQQEKLHAAICAAPAIFLEPTGLLQNKKATAHPAFVDQLSDPSDAEKRVVVDGSLITSRGPGTAFEFALKLIEQLHGEKKMQEVANPMVLPPSH